MIVRWGSFTPMWTFIALFLLTARSEAQVMGPAGGMPGPQYAGMMGGPGAGPEGYSPGPTMGSPMMGGPGGPMMMGGPGMGGPGMGGPGMGSPGMDGQDAMWQDGAGPGYGGGYEGGPGGAEDCGPYRGLLGDLLGLVGPYGDGGCCAPRFFDVSVEAMWLRRENAGRNIDLTSQGISGPIVLSTDDLSLTERASFRFMTQVQFRASGNLEFVYYGLFNNRDTAQVTDLNDDLFSVYSGFGTIPPGGFIEDGFARYNRIEYSSEFNNFEFSYRRHWQGPGCRFQGSWLYGIRYFQLDEDFDFITVSEFNAAQSHTNVNVNNSLTGGQLGGDLWVCIIPGLRAGIEGKAGVYGNHAQADTTITATSLTSPFTEEVKENDVAFVGDASFNLTYRLSQKINLKVGYNLLFVEGVSLATENFNTLRRNSSLPVRDAKACLTTTAKSFTTVPPAVSNTTGKQA